MRHGQAPERVVHHGHHLAKGTGIEPHRYITNGQVNGTAIAFIDRERSPRGEPPAPACSVIFHAV